MVCRVGGARLLVNHRRSGRGVEAVRMAELPHGGFEVVSEVGQIASGPGTVGQRAEAVLETLHRLVPFQAGVIWLLDPDRLVPVPVVVRGYDDAVLGYITSPANTEEI